MNEGANKKRSKYIKTDVEGKLVSRVSIVFLFSLFVMPQYFGIPFPAFDLTVMRIMMIIMILLILANDRRKHEFWHLLKDSVLAKIIIPFVIVITYTMILRGDLKAFLNPAIEFILLFVCAYIIKYVLGVDKTIQCVTVFMYILSIMGVIEYVLGKSLFSYLVTIPELYTGTYIRSGYYRIMGPTGHALAYGLLLIVATPVTCYNVKEKKVDVLCRPILLILLTLNVFFTGSRSNLALFILELFLLFLFSARREKKKFLFCFSIIGIAFVLILVVFNKSSISQYFMLQITTIIDEVFGSELSAAYGADAQVLGDSSSYRDLLKQLFTSGYVNPLLGYGRGGYQFTVEGVEIGSIDSFYIVTFVQYAYPGLLTFLLFSFYYLIRMIRDAVKKKSAICIAMAVGCICYMINLYWVDSLLTLKYFYLIFALYWGWSETKQLETEEKKPCSKYIRRFQKK